MSQIGREIIASLQELHDVLESGEPLEKHFTIRHYVVPAEPSEYDGSAVRGVRDRYKMSQAIFARFLCVSVDTVQSWEQGRRKPSPIARRLLDEMVANPEHYQTRFSEMAAPKDPKAASAEPNHEARLSKNVKGTGKPRAGVARRTASR
ncbi:MAG: transcriptional regulator [Paludisphaera borealis]|uniref:helix-turn-helix domain-containing protein n=1 Tax=Paludisphaera borealis TaxID=1387353 RepID=UPI0028452D12|nr:transcriptional regulator [Paludisphaera borealis]MDR3622246.1 transcriptional regulator [Paludisphaera borealis]